MTLVCSALTSHSLHHCHSLTCSKMASHADRTQDTMCAFSLARSRLRTAADHYILAVTHLSVGLNLEDLEWSLDPSGVLYNNSNSPSDDMREELVHLLKCTRTLAGEYQTAAALALSYDGDKGADCVAWHPDREGDDDLEAYLENEAEQVSYRSFGNPAHWTGEAHS